MSANLPRRAKRRRVASSSESPPREEVQPSARSTQTPGESLPSSAASPAAQPDSSAVTDCGLEHPASEEKLKLDDPSVVVHVAADSSAPRIPAAGTDLAAGASAQELGAASADAGAETLVIIAPGRDTQGPDVGQSADANAAGKVVNAARQYLRARRTSDEMMAARLKALSGMSRGETQRFFSDNQQRRKGAWTWHVLDERLRAGQGSSLAPSSIGVESPTVAPQLVSIASPLPPQAPDADAVEDNEPIVSANDEAILLPSLPGPAASTKHPHLQARLPERRRNIGPRAPRRKSVNQPSETCWVPSESRTASVGGREQKSWECKHKNVIRPTAVSFGCDCICLECGEHLGFEGWNMEYSPLGRLPQATSRGWVQTQGTDRNMLDEDPHVNYLVRSEDGAWIPVEGA